MKTTGARTTRASAKRRSAAWRARRIVTALSVTGFVGLGGCLAATHKNGATTNATGSSSTTSTSGSTSGSSTTATSSSGSVSASGSQSATSGSSQSTTHGS